MEAVNSRNKVATSTRVGYTPLHYFCPCSINPTSKNLSEIDNNGMQMMVVLVCLAKWTHN